MTNIIFALQGVVNNKHYTWTKYRVERRKMIEIINGSESKTLSCTLTFHLCKKTISNKLPRGQLVLWTSHLTQFINSSIASVMSNRCHLNDRPEFSWIITIAMRADPRPGRCVLVTLCNPNTLAILFLVLKYTRNIVFWDGPISINIIILGWANGGRGWMVLVRELSDTSLTI